MKRSLLVAACFLDFAVCGCVEGEQTFTFNPDCSGKVTIDAVVAPTDNLGLDDLTIDEPKKKDAEPNLDELRARLMGAFLGTHGTSAWKDVSASFTTDGKLKFSGTAYFKKLEDFDLHKRVPPLGTTFVAAPGAGGSLTFTVRTEPDENIERNPPFKLEGKTAADIAKLTDEQVDELVMRERVLFQIDKPQYVALLTHMKLKSTYVFPGTPSKTAGFESMGNSISFSIDGPKALASLRKFYAQDAATLRKMVRSGEAEAKVLEPFRGLEPSESIKIVVAKTTGPAFDFEKEVKEAVAAYPDLKKRYKLPEKLLPEGGTPPPMKLPPLQ